MSYWGVFSSNNHFVQMLPTEFCIPFAKACQLDNKGQFSLAWGRLHEQPNVATEGILLMGF